MAPSEAGAPRNAASRTGRPRCGRACAARFRHAPCRSLLCSSTRQRLAMQMLGTTGPVALFQSGRPIENLNEWRPEDVTRNVEFFRYLQAPVCAQLSEGANRASDMIKSPEIMALPDRVGPAFEPLARVAEDLHHRYFAAGGQAVSWRFPRNGLADVNRSGPLRSLIPRLSRLPSRGMGRSCAAPPITEGMLCR